MKRVTVQRLFFLIIFILPFLVNWHLFDPDPQQRWNLGADTMDHTYGIYHFAVRALFEGSFPMWNHWSFLGHPVFADFEHAPFNPVLLALALASIPMGFDLAFSFTAVLQMSVLGAGVFGLAEKITGSPRASFLAGVISAASFSGLFVSFYSFPLITPVIWLPYLFSSLISYKEGGDLRYFLRACVFMGLICLSGIINMIPYAFIFLLIFSVIVFRDDPFKAASVIFFISVGGLLLGAASLLPTLSFLPHSSRSVTGGWHFSIANQLYPEFPSITQMFTTFINPYITIRSYTRIYYGIMGGFLILAALKGSPRERNGYMLGAYACAAFAVSFSLGHYFFFNDAFYWLLPFLGKMHAHFRILFFLPAFLPVIAAKGYMDLAESPFSHKKSIYFFFPVALLLSLVLLVIVPETPDLPISVIFRCAADVIAWFSALYLAGWALTIFYGRKTISAKAFYVLLVVFTVFDLTVASWERIPWEKTAAPTTVQRMPLGREGGMKEYLMPRDYYRTNMNLVDRASSWRGFLTSGLKRYFYLLATGGVLVNWDRIVSVREYYTGRPNPYILQMLASPRLILANRYTLATGTDREVLGELSSRIGYAEPVVEGGVPFAARDGCDFSEYAVGEDTVSNCIGRIRVARLEYNGIELDVASNEENALLVWYDNYYPGWRAWVDNKPSLIYRANYTFKAVAVPKGAHRVVFRFRSNLFLVSIAVSALSWLALFLLAIKYRKRRLASAIPG